MKLAVESGELDGNCLTWESGKATWGKAMDTGDIIPLLAVIPKSLAEAPHVPLAINYAKTEEARQLIEMGIHQPRVFARPFMLPPGRVQMLRNAFEATIRDKQFLAEVEKTRMTAMPISAGRVGEGNSWNLQS